MDEMDMSRCSPDQFPSPSLSRSRSQSPSPRLLMSRAWPAGSTSSRLCRSNPMIRQSLSPSESSSSCTTGPCLRLTKDPVQPSTGSLSDIRRSDDDHQATTEEEDESFDDFPADVSSRPRAFTCPVTKAFNRKLRLKILNRPPTPTYKDSSSTTSSQQSIFDFHLMELNEKTTTTTNVTAIGGGGCGGGGSEKRMSNSPMELEAIMETL